MDQLYRQAVRLQADERVIQTGSQAATDAGVEQTGSRAADAGVVQTGIQAATDAGVVMYRLQQLQEL
jgi:hypothetical protein